MHRSGPERGPEPLALALFFLAVISVRFLFLWLSPYELSPDEAYYWDWSRRLDWGYYSKPPMVAWLIAASTWLLGQSEFGVRFPAMVLSDLTLVLLYLSGSMLCGKRCGFLAALTLFASIGGALSAYIMTIDAPLLFFWALSLWCLMRALSGHGLWSGQGCGQGGSRWWWIAAGCATGLGLLSKQTMIALPVALLLYLLLDSEGRRLIKGPWPWLYLALALLFLLPVFLWNMEHEWITLAHTAHHFEPGRAGLGRLKSFGDFLAGQLGVTNPVVFPLLVIASALLLPICARRMAGDGGAKGDVGGQNGLNGRNGWMCLLAACGPALIAAVCLLAFRQRINANWPAPFYLSSLLLLACIYSCPVAKAGDMLLSFRRRTFPAYRAGIGIGLFMVALVYLMPLWLPLSPIEGTKMDPTLRLRGWKELAQKVDSVLRGLPNPERTFIVARRRQTVSELAFYMPGRPHVYRSPGRAGRISSQYELWPGPEQGRSHWDALIVVSKAKALPQGLVRSFKRIEPLGEITIDLGGLSRSYRLWYGAELIKWQGG